MAILIVEDDPNGRKLLPLFRKRCGHRAEMTGDGAEAPVAIVRKQPDLMVADLKMPDVDRHELIRWRSNAVAAGIPILVVSAYRDPGSLGVAGSDAFRSKPYDPPPLAGTVACLVAGTADGA